MHRRFISALVLGAAFTAVLADAQAFDRRIRIKNETGRPIVSLSASSKESGWSGQVLGAVPPGKAAMATIDDGSGACTYDFVARLDDGSSRKAPGVNVCNLSVFTVK